MKSMPRWKPCLEKRGVHRWHLRVPHHPDKGFEGEIPELKVDCDCRKPKPGMLLKASEEYNIDWSQSWMIGDSERDIRAGKNAGCRTVLLCGDGAENRLENDYGQDMTANGLPEAMELINKPM